MRNSLVQPGTHQTATSLCVPGDRPDGHGPTADDRRTDTLDICLQAFTAMVQEQSCLPSDDLFLLLMALHTRWLVAAEIPVSTFAFLLMP